MREAFAASAAEAEAFERLRQILGSDMAMFVLCAYSDLPYKPEITANSWDAYLKRSRIKDGDRFRDGVTDPLQVFESGMADADRWAKVWGAGDDDSRYSPDDYRRLDEIFRTYTARLRSSGGYDDQQEDTLRHCSRMALLRDKSIAKGDKESIDKAAKLDKMIQDNLSAENLRKKDERPTQTVRIDGIVEALKKKYGVDLDLTKDQAMEVFKKWCQDRHYSCSIDAAEHAILAIINCTRANSDIPTMMDLPDAYRLDPYESEFSRKAERTENDIYTYLQLERRDRKPRR